MDLIALLVLSEMPAHELIHRFLHPRKMRHERVKRLAAGAGGVQGCVKDVVPTW
jgi:hypothetical protein